MKKKIITLALAVVMCLSVITSVTAADTLNRVASTIPGTDIEYNYVENVTVQIPGTEVTFEFEGVSELVGVTYGDIPSYRFAFYENGMVKFNNDLEGYSMYEQFAENGASWGDAYGASYETGDEITFEARVWKITRDAGTPVCGITMYSASIYNENNECIARVEFINGNGDGVNIPYDLLAYGENADIEKIDISLLDINYEEPIDYNIIEGANSVVNSNSLTIKADGDFDKFTDVKVDGEIIDNGNYIATEGSTVIEFKADYLKTLDAGEHTVSVVFTDGEATTKFEIKENIDNSNSNTNNNADKNENSDNLVTDVEIPNTDGTSAVAAALVAMAFSGMALVGLKKKNK